MKKDNMYNGSNSSTPNNKKPSVNSNKTSSFKMIDIDVKQAKKDVDTIFSYTSKRLDENSKNFRKTANDIFKETSKQAEKFFDEVEKRYEDIFGSINKDIDKFEDDMSEASEKSAKHMKSQYDKAFKDIDEAHRKSTELRQKREEEINKALKETVSYYEKVGDKTLKITYDKATGEAQNASQLSTSEKIANSIFNIDNADKFGNKLKVSIVEAFMSGGKKFVNLWMDRFEQGINRIVSTYEDTFHEVALMTGHNQSTYKGFQDETLKFLKDNNLDSVIRMSDVMKNMKDAVMSGISNAGEAQNVALQNSITKAINPFINTQSEAYQDLQLVLGQKFVDGTNGIIEAVNNGTAGTSRFITKNLNEMIQQFEPVIMNAKSEQFDKQFAELSADLEAAVQAGTMTSQEAEAYKQSMYSMVNDPYNTITNSSDIGLVSATIKSMKDGSFENQDFNKMAQNLTDVSSNLMKGGSTFDKFIKQSELMGGSSRVSAYTTDENLEKRKDIFAQDNSGSVEDAQKSLMNGIKDTFTSLWKKDTKAENAMTNVAQFEQTYPDGYKILREMLLSLKVIAGSTLLSGSSKLLDKFGPQVKDGISKLGSKLASKLPSGLKNFGGNTKSMGEMFINDIKADGLKNTAKTYAQTFGPELAKTLRTGLGKGGITAGGSASTVAKIVGGASLAGGLFMAGKDGLSGLKKIDEWFGKNAGLGDKISSFLGGAIGGTGKGIGQKGATVGGVAKNTLGNTAKGALIGAGVGSFIPVIGTAIGGAVGAGVGALSGLAGGERIAKGFKKAFELNPITNILGKQFKSIGKNFKQTTNEIKDLWRDSNKSLGEKVGGTFSFIKQGVRNTKKELIESISKGIEDSFIGKGYKAVTKFGSKVTKEFKKFKTDPVKYISEGLDKAKKKVSNFAKDVGEKISSVWDGTKKFFKDIGKGAKDADTKAKKADTKEDNKKKSSGSHASGLNSVPYDGYLAKLHKGETIFNEKASKQIAELFGILGTSTGKSKEISNISVTAKLMQNANKLIKENKNRNLDRELSDQFKKLTDNSNLLMNKSNSNLYKDVKSGKISKSEAKARASIMSNQPGRSLFGNNDSNKNMLDTSNLENAIYAIGDKIVKAIESNSSIRPKTQDDIVDRNSGTVKVRFGSDDNYNSLSPSLV